MDTKAPSSALTASSGSSFSIPTFPIRAPLTLDSDSECSLSSKGQKYDNFVSNSSSYGSDVSGFDSEGFLSGEDEFETASERPFVADTDDDSAEDADFARNHVVSRSFGNDPYGKTNEYGVPRAYVASASGEFVATRDDDLSGKDEFLRNHVVFRTIVDGPYGENNERGASRVYMSSTSGEGTSVRSIQRKKFVLDLDEDSIENNEFVEDGVAFKPFANDPYGESNENGVSRAYVSSTSRQRAHMKSIKGDRYGDLSADPDDDLMGNGNFVENQVVGPFVNDFCGESNKNVVSRAYVSSTKGEGTSVKLVEEENYRDFRSGMDDDLNENGEFLDDTVVIRPFVGDPCGIINENGVDRAYVADMNEEETSVKPIKGGKYGDFGESPVVDIGILSAQKISIPIAKLSRDSDEESSGFEDVEDAEFSSSLRMPNTHGLEKTESTIRVKESSDQKIGEEDGGSKFEPELDDKLFGKPEMGENVVENIELQGGEAVASVPDYTCSVDDAEGTISTKIMDENGDFLTSCDDKNDSTNGIKDSTLLAIDLADSVKKDNLGAEMEDGQQRSYDVLDPLPMSTLDLEFNGEFLDKEGYDKGHSERSFSIDDYSNGSIIDDLEQTSSPIACEESSKEFWLRTEGTLSGDFNIEVDSCEESQGKEVSNPNTSENSTRQNLSEEQRNNIKKIQLIRAKFSRLVQRLGLSLDDPVASQVLYRFILIERGPSNPLLTFESAMDTNVDLECENGNADFDFCLSILVIGKTGVGKSATINSIFGEEKSSVSAFEPATTCVKEIIGTVYGIKVRIVDTPGLRPSPKEQSFNRKVLSSVKRLMRKSPPDIVLYMDRIDMEKQDPSDLPLLKSITRCLGSSVWQKVIITLTHAGSTPLDGPNALPLSYDLYVAQKLHTIQLMIIQSLGHSILGSSKVSLFALVENHSSSSLEGENGEKVLLNGEKWRPKLLLLCSSMKIISEANLVVKDQDLFRHQKFFEVNVDSLPLTHLLSSLLHANTHPKTCSQQGMSLSAFDQEKEDEYSQLPPLKSLTKTLMKAKDCLNGVDQNSENLSVLRWRGEIQWSGNLQSWFPIGRGSKMGFQAGLNDKLNGQVSVKLSGSEQLQIVVWGILSMANAIVRNYF